MNYVYAESSNWRVPFTTISSLDLMLSTGALRSQGSFLYPLSIQADSSAVLTNLVFSTDLMIVTSYFEWISNPYRLSNIHTPKHASPFEF